jgi:hypothetical protein
MLVAYGLVSAFAVLPVGSGTGPGAADTLRIEVGSPELDLGNMKPHLARVVVERLVGDSWRTVAEWTNLLEVGDSAGRRVHRWTTRGRRPAADGPAPTWELFQTFDARSIAPLGLRRTSSAGLEVRLTFEGRRVRGTRRPSADGASVPVDIELARPAFPAAASDLVPMGVSLRDGLVLTAPVWQLGMPEVETRIFTVLGRGPLPVAGTTWAAWAVEERAVRGGSVVFIATWYIVEEPPYMVYAEVETADGAKQRMTEVLVQQ